MACDIGIECSFLSQINRARVELGEKVSRAHQVLQERETALLSELQQLEDTYRGEGVDRQIDQLRIPKEHLIATLTDNKNKEFLEKNVALLDTQMRELAANLEKQRDNMISVKLEWDAQLERVLDGIGAIIIEDYNEQRDTRKHIRSKVQVIQSIKGVIHYFPQTVEPKRIEKPPREQPAGRDCGIISEPLSPTTKMNIFPHNLPTNKHLDKFDDPVSNIPPVYQSNAINRKLSSTANISNPTVSSLWTKKPNKYNHDTTLVKDSGHKRTQSTALPTNQTHSPLLAPDWDGKNSRDVITSIIQTSAHYKPQAATESKPIRSLKNLGNTCFMNCILQCLSHTLPIRQLYVSDEYKQHVRSRRGDLSYIFKRVLLELWDTTHQGCVAPYDLKRQVGIVAPRFSGDNQHDAQEFMRFLLNELHDEINRASVMGRKPPADNETLQDAVKRYQAREDSRIHELFGGMLRSEVCCSVCHNKSVLFDPFMDLALPIPKRKSSYSRPTHSYSYSYDLSLATAVKLEECLAMFTDAVDLNDDERLYCAKCKKLTASTKQLHIAMFPRYLVIQLKRFSGDTVRTKLSTPVSFDDTWIPKDSGDQTYSLYAIVSHSDGKYVAYCRHNKVWRCFNDTMVRDVRWEHVRHQEAYILFYEKND